jgi:putative SOS response-associated peptidase YedK
MRWGLVAAWERDLKKARKVINARAETLQDKPMFRDALKQRRCLVPADGFFEWQGVGAKKLPWRFVLKSGKPFCFAGIFNEWIDQEVSRRSGADDPDEPPPSARIETFAIITTEANDIVRPVHDRMPVIVQPEHYDWWIDPAPKERLNLSTLKPSPAELMHKYRVGAVVNSSANETPECLKPV